MQDILPYFMFSAAAYFLSAWFIRTKFKRVLGRSNTYVFQPPKIEEFWEIVEYFGRPMLPLFVALGLMALTNSNWPILLGIGGFYFAGWHIRSELRKDPNVSLQWLVPYSFHPVISTWLERWPMLAFDFWTVGISGLLFLYVLDAL